MTIAPPADGYLNGVLDEGANEADIQLPLNWDSDTPILITQDNEGSSLGWRTQLPVAGDFSDDDPVAAIRRMSQSQYNAITPDDNTLYIIV